MDKIKKRAVIKYLHKKGLTAKQIHKDMQATSGQSILSCTMVEKWAAQFKRGQESIEDDSHNGQPSTSRTQENIKAICYLIIYLRNIIVDELRFSKISARWVLTQLNKNGINSQFFAIV